MEEVVERRCTKCKQPGKFYKQKARPDGLSNWCSACFRKQAKTWRQSNPKRWREICAASNAAHPGTRKNQRLRQFDISLLQYNALLALQNNVCAICHKPETLVDSRTGRLRALAVDHDHTTKRVRGLLCSACNTGLGKFKDNIDLLIAAVSYLFNPESRVLTESQTHTPEQPAASLDGYQPAGQRVCP
jgi:hypothetical protein